MFHSPSASALTFDWAKLGSGDFNDPKNWDVNNFPDTVTPGTNDDVTFDVGLSSYTVTFPGNEIANNGGFGGIVITSIASYKSRNLRVRDSGVIFSGSTESNRAASTYTITNPAETEADRGIIIGVAAGENAKLSLSHAGFSGGGLSALIGAAATLGDVAGSTGTLNVGFGKFNVTGSDGSTPFTDLAQLIVGNRGTGNLNVTGGADVNVSGSNSKTSLGRKAGSVGNVKISGAGSTWTTASELWIGGNGTGALTVQNGGSLVTDGSGGTDGTVVGTLAGSRGSVTVTGAGSTWTNSAELKVGNGGNGELIIANGGRLNSPNGATTTVGGNTFGIATVTGAGSTWVTPGMIQVQGRGQGALQILNGGSVTAGRVTMTGIESGGGEIFLSGPGSTLNVISGPLAIGKFVGSFDVGRSSVVINPGARVNVTHDVDLHKNGVLKLQGGTLAAASIGSSALASSQIAGTFEWTSGTLHAGVVHSTSVINQAGKLAPGLPLGSTTIDGSYTQLAAASMEFEIGGPLAGSEFDVVNVTSSASLDGELDLSLTGGFVPAPSQTFAILNAGSLSGAFDNAPSGQRVTTADGGGSFLVNYGVGSPFNQNQIVLSAFQPAGALAADFDGDGKVDGADLNRWRDDFAANAMSDADNDGDSDGADFLDWQRRRGSVAAATGSIQAVPEPTATILILMGMLAVCSRRDR